MERVPKNFFFTKGSGTGKTAILSFEAALKHAKISPYNLVKVSSIIPPNCEEISRKEGLKLLNKGEIVYTVLSEHTTTQSNHKISCALGIARAIDKNLQGYVYEHSEGNSTGKNTGEFAEKCAISMMANASGLNFPNIDTIKDYDGIQQMLSESKYISIGAESPDNPGFLTVVAALVFVL
jgi:arginine decarboxylase